MGSSFSKELLTTLWDETGNQKSNMAIAKPEVLISQLLAGVQLLNGVVVNTVGSNRKSEIKEIYMVYPVDISKSDSSGL